MFARYFLLKHSIKVVQQPILPKFAQYRCIAPFKISRVPYASIFLLADTLFRRCCATLIKYYSFYEFAPPSYTFHKIFCPTSKKIFFLHLYIKFKFLFIIFLILFMIV
jgi:hypothetical protein